MAGGVATRAPPSFVRTVSNVSRRYKDAEIPAAPDDLVCELSRRYVLLYELITGERFDFEAASAASASDRPGAVAACLAGL